MDSTFKLYQHVEKIGYAETDGLLEGECYFFPKIDGTNASVWVSDGVMCAGSRTRQLSIESDNAGFFAYVSTSNELKLFFEHNPHIRLFGEWLVPHSLRTYRDEAWRKFYVFDVLDGDKYVHYNEYSVLLEEFNIEYIPPILMVNSPSQERIINTLSENSFLIKDGEGSGEGVVVKRYDFVNKYGKTVWGKAVTNEFKAKHIKAMGVREVKEKIKIEDSIAASYVTKSLVDKNFAKIELDAGGFSGKQIPRLLNSVFYDVVKEDIWEIVKEYKNPTIDFSRLMKCVFAHVKVYKPELF